MVKICAEQEGDSLLCKIEHAVKGEYSLKRLKSFKTQTDIRVFI